ncbi:TPA: EAL domain-containing protein [Vibrio campbellii]|uniref:EAL domain-containing protein n=1 Tax=Vibrio campbellii TaxID=680 RepID=A0AAQ3B3R1_9VIBR|nr:EAL domain-containing protein [Vibrio campbellii]WDG11105.1 EAL domain-containing protein [Vibrio campbellii]HDM8231122.1 EAL domain-containing protein [Vibrio campbellii]
MSDFYLIYQPKVRDYKITSLEALLRPKDSDLSIMQYLSLKADTKLLDLQVLAKCVEDMDLYQLTIPVSVNIHPSSLSDETFVSTAIEMINGRQINIEVIEYQEFQVTQEMVLNLESLKENGIKVSIDDFGTNLMSEELALRMKVDEVKFDKALIEGIETDRSKLAVLSCIYRKIAKLCTPNIVFEGVENVLQLEAINEFATSPTIQGYYFYKPMHLSEVGRVLSLTK